MENTVLQAMQHRKVLFLISLPIPKFQDCIEDVNECLDELRQLNVDVREHIWCEDLAEANRFDVIIVVADHDTTSEGLVLADGTLSIKDFVSSIPVSFNGVIDFSSCYSATAYATIKERCPQCKVQVTLSEAKLLKRLIIYPTLVEYLYDNPEIDYGTAYGEVSKAVGDVAGEIDDTDTSNAPMAHLGQKKTSIFAPLEAKRKSLVPINIFIHCDSEKNEVRIKAARGTEVHINSEDLGELKEGDSLTLTLSFIQCDDIQFLHIEGPDSKDIIVTNELIKEYFIVKIDEGYNAPNFGCYIHILKNGEEIRKYPIFIEVVDYNNSPQTEIMVNNQDNTANHSDERDAISYVEDFSTMKKYQLKGSGPRNLKEVYSFLNENNIIPPFVDLGYLWNCITHAYFTPLWGNDNNTFILHLMHKAKKGFVDEKEWADAACKSIGIERSRLGKNPPSDKKFGEKMPDLEFKH